MTFFVSSEGALYVILPVVLTFIRHILLLQYKYGTEHIRQNSISCKESHIYKEISSLLVACMLVFL